jgi:hypothetical protein
MTVMEIFVVRAAIPLISIERLPFGCSSYKGHVIALLNDVGCITETLPRSSKRRRCGDHRYDAGTREDGSNQGGAVFGFSRHTVELSKKSLAVARIQATTPGPASRRQRRVSCNSKRAISEEPAFTFDQGL